MNMFGSTSLKDLMEMTELDPSGLKIIADKREIIKLKFPFYMMEVRHFEILLEHVCDLEDRKFINNDDVKT
jgi:hypothetical protein